VKLQLFYTVNFLIHFYNFDGISVAFIHQM